MGYSKMRRRQDGKPRYTAVYLDVRGLDRSAGTFATKRDADAAWRAAETRVAEGRNGDPQRGRQTFCPYVESTWLPNHVIELSTRESYTYSLDKHILPWFGPLKMIEIMPLDVREWVRHMGAVGVSPATVRHNRIILSAIFTTALNDQVTLLHPCKGVKTPTVPVKPKRIITPEQFDTIYSALPDAAARLLVELDIESGLRWGELAELRVRDVDASTGIVTVSRVVVQLNPKFHPDGGRFLVKQYPKDKEWRRFMLSPHIVGKLTAHIEANALDRDDLLFELKQSDAPRPRLRAVPTPDAGLTEPNAAGRRYAHGTMSGYSAGRCRCGPCKASYADYRAQRRAARKDSPRERRLVDTDGHLPRDWFRVQVWLPAVRQAGLDFPVRMHDLRHAHASWLLAGGADLQVVKERMGHASIATTEKYLHTLPTADKTALDALARIRKTS